jgi:predicted PP-loop superfamily ATPase
MISSYSWLFLNNLFGPTKCPLYHKTMQRVQIIRRFEIKHNFIKVENQINKKKSLILYFKVD